MFDTYRVIVKVNWPTGETPSKDQLGQEALNVLGDDPSDVSVLPTGLLPDSDELAAAVLDTMKAAHGDSNDTEIDAYRNALDIALGRLGVEVRELTDEEIAEAEEGE